MVALHMNSRAIPRQWRLFHFLAAWTVGSISAAILADTVFSVSNPSTLAELLTRSPGELALRIAVGLGAVAAMWLWIQMIRDYFRAAPASHRVGWGVALFAGLFVGGLLYFWFVWRARTQPSL